MKKTTFLVLAGCIMLTLSLMQCNNTKKEADEKADTVVNKVTPVPLPTNIVPGFNFPEDSTKINGWINDKKFANSYDSASIYSHAWGIWAGLTAVSGQKFAGNDLLVYETWLGLNEVRNHILNNNTKAGCGGTSFERNGRLLLHRPKQFDHGTRFAAVSAASNKGKAKDLFENAGAFWVTVSYSPDAACFATENQIFKQSIINKSYQEGGMGSIKDFPSKSLTIKPAYLVYEDTSLLFKMPVWSNKPDTANDYFFANANQFVFVDRNNKQPDGKIAVPVDSSKNLSTAQIAAATVNLKDFISLRIDAKMAAYMNKQDSVQGMNNSGNGYGKAKKGQIALLVAMHVTTKEISNWTWQSYYWTPTPKQPGVPSSDLAASLRPSQIKGAAANYACVASYVMLTPNNAPNSIATGANFGYNPYLEAGFGPGVFTYPNTYDASYQYGMQSNCMSCHALAIADTVTNVGRYTTNQTIDLKGVYFRNQVSLDFAWSVQTALIHDTLPYWYWTKK